MVRILNVIVKYFDAQLLLQLSENYSKYNRRLNRAFVDCWATALIQNGGLVQF